MLLSFADRINAVLLSRFIQIFLSIFGSIVTWRCTANRLMCNATPWPWGWNRSRNRPFLREILDRLPSRTCPLMLGVRISGAAHRRPTAQMCTFDLSCRSWLILNCSLSVSLARSLIGSLGSLIHLPGIPQTSSSRASPPPLPPSKIPGDHAFRHPDIPWPVYISSYNVEIWGFNWN